ncbi:hypothetical protein AGABI2DRAFT_179152, partial [Agaricus bisporus var. bisporus H97]|uniref:hypothetical protein n=1 Tax=Agaricus bisporus var. bisporus (strain H97 / ATCC MYA-4626 / FGSC 10389) TaxID=936046 RepID=UPI00029F7F3F
NYPTKQILFNYSPSSEFEVSVQEGEKVQVVEPDDGSGWAKVLNSEGKKGLVPASYVGYGHSDEGVPVRQGTGQRVRAIYPYRSQGSDELELHEGEVLELSVGGQEYGNGWWEGFNKEGRKGIFPSNYIEHLVEFK